MNLHVRSADKIPTGSASINKTEMRGIFRPKFYIKSLRFSEVSWMCGTEDIVGPVC